MMVVQIRQFQHLLARSAVTRMLDEFYGPEIFRKFAFDVFSARNNMKNVLLTTYALNLGTLSLYSEMQQLGITNFTHLSHVSGFATLCMAKVLIFSC